MSFLPPSGDSRRRPNGDGGGRPAQGGSDPDPMTAGSAAGDEDAVFTYRAGRVPTGNGPRSRAEARQAGEDARSTVGRSFGLTALGTVLPGAGLSMTRRRNLGRSLLGLAVVALLVIAWYLVTRGALASALDLATRPRLLRGLAVALVVGGLVWIGSIVLTALTSRPRRMSSGQQWGLTAFTAAMCLVIAAPVAMGLRYINAHTTAVDKIFQGPGTASGGSPEEEDERPRVEEEDPWAHVSHVNVLLLGSDASDTRDGIRTDSMIVASIDTDTGDTVLFGIPRNLQQVPIPADSPLHRVWPEGYNCGNECLMNGIWTEAEAQAEAHPEWFVNDPTPGLTATREVIAEVIGQPINYTVIVNLDGFRDLVDAMGGVEINVRERVPLGGETWTDANGNSYLVEGTENGWLEIGPKKLNGYQALWYSRSRITSDDFSRMRRQRCVVAALVNQVNPMTMVQRYPQIAEVAGDNIAVSIDQEELPAWADLVLRVQKGTIRSLPFTNENIDTVNPDYTAIHATVLQAISPPPPEPSPSAGEGAEATQDPASETTEAPEPSAPDEATGTAPEEPSDELTDVAAVC